MPTLIVTLDLDCFRWRKRIEEIISCIQARTEFVFEKVEYEKNKVIVSGPFDADKLCCMLRCKIGCLIKNMEVVKPPPPPPPPPEKPCQHQPCPQPCPTPRPCCQGHCRAPSPPPCPTPRPCCQGHCRPPSPPPCQCPAQIACRCRCCCRGMPCPLVIIIIEDRPGPCGIM
nr:unnamed protein product [Digitaria exilis]